MTLNQLIRIQSIIDKRAIRSDTQEFLKKNTDVILYDRDIVDHHIDRLINQKGS